MSSFFFIEFFDQNVNPTFTSPFFKDTHYIAVPEGILIDYVEDTDITGRWLYNSQTDDDEYTKKKIIINGKFYYLWYVTYRCHSRFACYHPGGAGYFFSHA